MVEQLIIRYRELLLIFLIIVIMSMSQMVVDIMHRDYIRTLKDRAIKVPYWLETTGSVKMVFGIR
jgi:hypothetical protein